MATLPTSLKPDAIFEQKREFKTTIVEFENGEEQRFPNWGSGKSTYLFAWNLIPNTTLNSIIDFFNAHKGQALSWTFADSRIGGTQTLRFNADELDVTRLNAYFSSAQIEVRVC